MKIRTRQILIHVVGCLLFLLSSGVLRAGGAFDEVIDVPGLPRVLLIGDSISIDYTPDTREMLKGNANVHRPACNCMYSGNVAANMKAWLGGQKWDVVHFNAGIWDCHFVDENGNMLQGYSTDYYDEDKIRTSKSQYRKNLNEIIDIILASGATPVFATTTTIPRWNEKRRNYLNELNGIAEDLMFYKQVQVDDLYSYSLPYLQEWQLSDQVHFNPLGKKQLARKVSQEILKAIGSEAKISDWQPEKTTETTMYGRRIVCYKHDCIKQWGYERPHFESFYVTKAGMELSQNPLVVFLHSAGGDAAKELAGNAECVAGYGDEFVGLMLNSPSELEAVDGSVDYDWWWGAKAIHEHPELYKDKMTPIENRVIETIEWVVQNYNIDRNRVYLRGVSMGGSGALGIGLAHGDVFAAVQADVFAGVDHVVFRLKNTKTEPPYAVMLFSQLDVWSKGAEQLLNMIDEDYLGMSYAWDIYGHDHKKLYENADQSVVNFSWLSIRRNQAYPVFTNASGNNKYPGNMSLEADQKGQVNAYFRWSVLEDTVDSFIIELRTVKQMSQSITTDVTLRRLQNFSVSPDVDRVFNWIVESEGKIKTAGNITPNSKGLLTIKKIEIGSSAVRLKIVSNAG